MAKRNPFHGSSPHARLSGNNNLTLKDVIRKTRMAWRKRSKELRDPLPRGSLTSRNFAKKKKVPKPKATWRLSYSPKGGVSYISRGRQIAGRVTSFGTTGKQSFKNYIGSKIKKPSQGFFRNLSKQYPHRVTKKKRVGKGEWYGPYPNPLGMIHIIELKLSGKLAIFLNRGRFSETHKMMIHQNIRDAMIALHEKIIDFAWTQIEKYAPKDTGALRQSLLSSLTEISSKRPTLDKLELNLRFFSELEYAGIVNRMPNDVLQHTTAQGIRGRYGAIKNDPDAVKGFYSVIILNTRNMIKNVYIKEFIKDVQNGMGITLQLTYNIIKSFFTYRGVHV